MKKVAIILIYFTPLFGAGQCIPNPNYTSAGIYPDTISGLDPAYVGQSYNQIMTHITPIDSLVYDPVFNMWLTVTFIDFKLLNISGLPPNFTYGNCDPTSCSIAAGSTGCFEIYSSMSPTTSHIGIYPLSITISASFSTTVMGVPILDSMPYTFTGWSIEILPALSSWDCVNGSCINLGNGTGMYNDSLVCVSSCNPTWDCVNGSCINLGNGTGVYNDSLVCVSDCAINSAIVSYKNNNKRKLMKLINIFGKEVSCKQKKPFFYIYDDGTVEKRLVIE